MDVAFIYVGLAQSIFSAVLIFLKKPRTVANKILGLWLLALGLMFALNVFKLYFDIKVDIWPVSLTLSVSFPIFLYVYTQYILSERKQFKTSDFIHFSPVIIGFALVLYFLPSLLKGVDALLKQLQTIKPPIFVGYIFELYIGIYSILALILIRRYRRQAIKKYFSYSSYKISLNWLIFIVLSFFVVIHIMIFISMMLYQGIKIDYIEEFRSGSLLVFVYVISFWGYKQTQIDTDVKPPRLNLLSSIDDSISERYQKSGLTKKKAEQYSKVLIDHMNNSESWRNNKLTLELLSEETKIPKHIITQVLNENIKKNFYTFVNEYRAEQAKNMIKSKDYDSLSFVGIAFESGFNSKTAFNVFFKKYIGMTPSEYKNKVRK